MSDNYIDPLIGTPPGQEQAAAFGAFEGADRTSHELAMWNPPVMSADMEILPEKGIMDARTRDSSRNDAFIRAGTTIKQDHIVGELFMLNSKPHYKVLGLDETWAQEFQEEVEAKFTLYAESPRNYIDAGRRNTLTDMVRLAVGIHSVAGEVLSSVEWMRKGPRPYRTALKMIDLDRLSNPNNLMDDQFLRGGVKLDRFGAPVGYWVRKTHPTDWTFANQFEWQFIPLTRGQVVGKPSWDRLQMIHIYSQWRPAQSRGISDMVTALKEMKMTRKYRDIVLQNAVLNAVYAASIESDLPTDVVMQQAGGQDPDAVAKYAQAYLGAIAQYTKGKQLTIDGVKVPHFFPGTKMNLQNVQTPGGLGQDFEASLLRYIAAGLGVGYSELSKNFADANYSNIKAELAQTERRMRSEKRVVADKYATCVFRLWLEEALNMGDITSMPRNAPNWYEGLNADAYSACTWIGASRGQIEELKETQAAVLRVNNKLSTWEDELSRLGRDWRATFRQWSREQKMMEELGIPGPTTDGQNMMNAAGGQPDNEGASPRRATSED